jgi:hypothetical protein
MIIAPPTARAAPSAAAPASVPVPFSETLKPLDPNPGIALDPRPALAGIAQDVIESALQLRLIPNYPVEILSLPDTACPS